HSGEAGTHGSNRVPGLPGVEAEHRYLWSPDQAGGLWLWQTGCGSLSPFCEVSGKKQAGWDSLSPFCGVSRNHRQALSGCLFPPVGSP
ncbi:unnamed protein product, partial [Staurois parvus]